ncbi:hypothetical protein [Bacillus mojavensis]
MEELLKFFKEKGVSLQITVDINYKPTVHAIPAGCSVADLKFADGETVMEALENMKVNLFEKGEKMKNETATKKVKELYVNNSAKSVSVVKISEAVLKDVLSVCDSKKHMEERIEWYDDEDNHERVNWIDVEGEGYGWLWLNEENDESKWHGLLKKSLQRFVDRKRNDLNEDSEYVIIVNTEEGDVIYHFIERDNLMCDTIYTFSDNEIDY